MPESIELDPEMCERLLHLGVTGRVAFSTPDGPQIIPISYTMIDHALVFRTSPYSLLAEFADSALVAVEVDHLDPEHDHGWSVVAHGRCVVIEDPQEVAHVNEVGAPQPWAAGSRNLYLRLRWTQISGRKLGLHWDPLSDPPVRPVTAGRSSGAPR